MAKATKAAAHYRKGTAKQNCDNCRWMHSDGTCTKVEGIVTKTMTSDYWMPVEKAKR